MKMFSTAGGPVMCPSADFVDIDDLEYKVKVPSSDVSGRCDCTPEEKCGVDCVNRQLYIECSKKLCCAGDECQNQRIQKKNWAAVEVFDAGRKGLGLRACQRLPARSFIMEYCGEVVGGAEFERRKQQYMVENRKHFYFMTLERNIVVDATRRGTVSRFINHSCQPNAEMQKWSVKGKTRIGIFVLGKDVEAGEEIVFNYDFQRYGSEAQECFCGAPNCEGVIGKRADEKKRRKNKRYEGYSDAFADVNELVKPIFKRDQWLVFRGVLETERDMLTFLRLVRYRFMDDESFSQLLATDVKNLILSILENHQDASAIRRLLVLVWWPRLLARWISHTLASATSSPDADRQAGEYPAAVSMETAVEHDAGTSGGGDKTSPAMGGGSPHPTPRQEGALDAAALPDSAGEGTDPWGTVVRVLFIVTRASHYIKFSNQVEDSGLSEVVAGLVDCKHKDAARLANGLVQIWEKLEREIRIQKLETSIDSTTAASSKSSVALSDDSETRRVQQKTDNFYAMQEERNKKRRLSVDVNVDKDTGRRHHSQSMGRGWDSTNGDVGGNHNDSHYGQGSSDYAGGNVPDLPEPWRKAVCPKTQRPYYYHSITMKVTWDRPVNTDATASMVVDVPMEERPERPAIPGVDLSLLASQSGTQKEVDLVKLEAERRDRKAALERFRGKAALVVKKALNKYRAEKGAVKGRINTTDDFKHAARKIVHVVMQKEESSQRNKQAQKTSEAATPFTGPVTISFTKNTHKKVLKFVDEYMSKFPGDYVSF